MALQHKRKQKQASHNDEREADCRARAPRPSRGCFRIGHALSPRFLTWSGGHYGVREACGNGASPCALVGPRIVRLRPVAADVGRGRRRRGEQCVRRRLTLCARAGPNSPAPGAKPSRLDAASRADRPRWLCLRMLRPSPAECSEPHAKHERLLGHALASSPLELAFAGPSRDMIRLTSCAVNGLRNTAYRWADMTSPLSTDAVASSTRTKFPAWR